MSNQPRRSWLAKWTTRRELLSGADSFNDSSSHFSRSFDGLSTFLHQNESLLARLNSEQICLWVLPSCITIRRTSFAHAVQFGSLGRTTSPSLSAASSYMLIIFPQMNSAQVKSSGCPTAALQRCIRPPQDVVTEIHQQSPVRPVAKRPDKKDLYLMDQ